MGTKWSSTPQESATERLVDAPFKAIESTIDNEFDTTAREVAIDTVCELSVDLACDVASSGTSGSPPKVSAFENAH